MLFCSRASLQQQLLRPALRRTGTAVAAMSLVQGFTSTKRTGFPALPAHHPVRFASSLSKKSPYAVLGLKRTATKEEIKKAYRVMARKHHPDAPGGDHQKFQEIQEAYEQIKTGVWIGGEAGAGTSEESNRATSVYSNLRYRTRTHRSSNVSFEQFYTEMHTGKVKRNPFAEEDERQAKKQEEGKKNSREAQFAAWFRFITLWCLLFVGCRVLLVMLFPPARKTPKKKPPPPKPYAAPKPLAASYS